MEKVVLKAFLSLKMMNQTKDNTIALHDEFFDHANVPRKPADHSCCELLMNEYF